MPARPHPVLAVLCPVAVLTVLAVGLLYSETWRDGLHVIDAVMLAVFAVLFAWIAFWFWIAAVGTVVVLRTRRARLALNRGASPVPAALPLTATVIPIHNENAEAVFARARAMLESLGRTAERGAFEMFVLSDTTDPDTWLREEIAWAKVREIRGLPPVYYRRRPHKFRKKSGNITDFCERWGGRYEFMIVLDADSVMDGETMVELVRRMVASPKLGILQAPSFPAMQHSFLARLDQFAAFAYGPAVFAGMAYFFGGASSFWGHNAVIRLRAFAEHCGLPGLPGKPPFGGPILSHDFVEAALMCRAGYEVRLAWDLTSGSYEQCPTSLETADERDRRWCRGNLQHLRLLFAPSLPPMCRAHFGIGVLFYGVSILWALFILLAAARFEADFVSDSVHAEDASAFAPFVITGLVAALLLGSKLAGATIAWLERPRGGPPRWTRFLASVGLEVIVAAVTAPIRMVSHLISVASALVDSSTEWATASRGDSASSLARRLRAHGPITLLGISTGACLLRISDSLALWLAPVWLAWALAVPIAAILASRPVGMRLRRAGLLVTPTEARPPAVIRRSIELSKNVPDRPSTFAERFESIVTDPWLNDVHVGLLAASSRRDRPGHVVDPLVIRALESGLADLSPKEAMTLLSHPAALRSLHLARIMQQKEARESNH